MNDISKLPKWAQERMGILERQVEDLKRHVLELAEPESIGETDTVLYTYSVNPDVKLPLGSLIRFTVNGVRFDVRVRRDNRVNDRVLEVRADCRA